MCIRKNIPSLPGVANPHVVGGDGSVVTALHHIGGQNTLLLLVLVLLQEIALALDQKPSIIIAFSLKDTHVQHEDGEVGLLALATKLLLSNQNILLELAHSVLESGPGVVNLINNEDVLANQVGHLQGAQVQPLCAGHLGARDFLGIATAKILVEGQTNSLDRDVGITRTLEEGSVCGDGRLGLRICIGLERMDIPKDTSGNIATTANRDHQVRGGLLQDSTCRLLAELVNLYM